MSSNSETYNTHVAHSETIYVDNTYLIEEVAPISEHTSRRAGAGIVCASREQARSEIDRPHCSSNDVRYSGIALIWIEC